MPCVVVFSGEKIRVRPNADEVTARLAAATGPERFERDEGGAIWVNPSAVLYVAELGGEGVTEDAAPVDVRAALLGRA